MPFGSGIGTTYFGREKIWYLENDDGNHIPYDNGNDHSCTKIPSTSDVCENDIATSMGDNTSSEGNVPSIYSMNKQRDFPENLSQVQPTVRRSSRPEKMLAKFNDYVVGSSVKYGLEKFGSYSNLSPINYCFSTTLNKSSEPCRKHVGCKWLFKIKYKSIGEIARYKARLVSKAYSQREGFDYLETFSLVVKMSTMRRMLNVVICNSWILFQLDIDNSFLYGDLSVDVYMNLPPGFDNQKSKVSKLSKSLYGLKQAPRQWNAKLTMALVENGFVQSNLSEIEKFKLLLKSKFQIKELGKLKYFFGIYVLENENGLCLSQIKYSLELLHEYGLLAAKPVDAHLPENTTFNHIESDDDKILSSPDTGVHINKNGNIKLRAYSDWARCPVTRNLFQLSQHMNNLETQLNAETLHEMDSKSSLSVIKAQFERFINSELLKPLDIYSRSFSSDREVRENFRDYTKMTAQTFKETIIQNMNSIEQCINRKASHEQELKMTLKKLSERQLQIQQCKVQEVQSSRYKFRRINKQWDWIR
ncbi:ribonuclease H-like domain-containing protein [Tanacetum coccineum]